MRAAVVGGTAYAVGKHHANASQRESEQDAEIQDLQQPDATVPEQSSQAASDRFDELERLKQLLDSGVLTQAEFDQEKQKILRAT